MAGKRRISKELRHVWQYDRTAKRYLCDWCGQWTANLPLYKYEICPATDRRKGVEERRRP